MTSLSSMYQGDEEGRTKAFGWTSTGLLIGGFGTYRSVKQTTIKEGEL